MLSLTQWPLCFTLADAFEIAVSKTQNTVSLHQRYSGEYIVCNIAATVHNDIGCDLSQPIQQLYACFSVKGGMLYSFSSLSNPSTVR